MSPSKKKMERKELVVWFPRHLELLRTVGSSESQASLLEGRAARPCSSWLTPVDQGRGSHPFPVELSINSLFHEGSSWFLRRKGCVKQGVGVTCYFVTGHAQEGSSLLIYGISIDETWHCHVSLCPHPLDPLFVMSSASPFSASLRPTTSRPRALCCFFTNSGSHLSTFLSWPLALAPAPAASRAPRAPRTSRAAGTPGRIATSGRAGTGALAMAQEARSAIWKPGLFCNTTQKYSWAHRRKQTVTTCPLATLCTLPALGVEVED